MKASSSANYKMMPYLGRVLVLTRIIYATLDEETLLEPWDKPTRIDVGTKSIPGLVRPKATGLKRLKAANKKSQAPKVKHIKRNQ